MGVVIPIARYQRVINAAEVVIQIYRGITALLTPDWHLSSDVQFGNRYMKYVKFGPCCLFKIQENTEP